MYPKNSPKDIEWNQDEDGSVFALCPYGSEMEGTEPDQIASPVRYRIKPGSDGRFIATVDQGSGDIELGRGSREEAKAKCQDHADKEANVTRQS